MNVTEVPESILDLRSVAGQERCAAVLSALDELVPGNSVRLLSAEDPAPILKDLQCRRKGQFEWCPLGEEARSFSVELARRQAAAGSLRRVTEALRWDHQRIEALERRAQRALVLGDRGEARCLYALFRQRLNRHIRCEEEILFPVFEMRSGLPHGGPTAVLRAEHREIRMALEEIVRGLPGGEQATEEPRRALLAGLADHLRREDAFLYPSIDQLVTEAESDTLVARFQAFPK